jgi:hypothetical protein
MKRLIIVLVSLAFAFSAAAQGHPRLGNVKTVRPRVAIVGGYAPMFPAYGFGYGPGFGLGYGYRFGYHPFYNPMYRAYRPSKLDLQIEDIRKDYQDKIWSVRRDKDLSRKERRQIVSELKQEREDVIYDTRRNYYKSDNRS